MIVVGSGVAGLVTALTLKARCREAGLPIELAVVTKSTIDESNSRYAQGGIAAAVMPGDTVESHIADTLAAGAGLSDPDAVAALCVDGPARIRDLIGWGVGFDTEGAVPGAPFEAGLEGAHSAHRILHAGGDATGLSMESALVRAVRGAGIAVLSSTFLADLVLDGPVLTDKVRSNVISDGLSPRESGAAVPTAPAVVGVEVIRGGVREVLTADAVVLATGGLGQLYPHTTNPVVATGDGAAAAWRAGAVIADAEFVQFHPTALAAPGSFLISEAVRGDGAVLRNAEGARFMDAVHPLADLAPRDVVARAIAAEMARTGAPVMLDATSVGAAELARRFPTISEQMRRRGLDWAHVPVPVAPAAHYWMGGVATDLDGRTSVPGLWAVGEVSCTGVHGANRLASNSLLESLVFAHRAAVALAAELGSGRFSRTKSGMTAVFTDFSGENVEGSAREPSRAEVQELLWAGAGVARDAAGLRAARDRLSGWAVQVERDDASPEAVARLETANLLQLGRLVVESALAREESRGGHFRTDVPETLPAFVGHLLQSRTHPQPRLHRTSVAAALGPHPTADDAPAPAVPSAPSAPEPGTASGTPVVAAATASGTSVVEPASASGTSVVAAATASGTDPTTAPAPTAPATTAPAPAGAGHRERVTA
ncbi:L-aspartate oxidase [Herbiconiux sp. A18JL235]|uniref:L-aspartate oxidase n=1 Tax=Herbiconiux sp. A18JL235 TaxID=3152363 RepID=A0AB39BH30_9MICO